MAFPAHSATSKPIAVFCMCWPPPQLGHTLDSSQLIVNWQSGRIVGAGQLHGRGGAQRPDVGKPDVSEIAHFTRVNVSGCFAPSMVSSIESPTCRPVRSTLWPSIGPVVRANALPTTFPSRMLADCFP